MIDEATQHLIDILRTPEREADLQREYNAKRLMDAQLADSLRPAFLPLQHYLPAQAQTMPIPDKTTEENDNVIIKGVISNGQNLRINLYRRSKADYFIDAGDKPDAHLSLEGLSGKSVSAAGFAGVYPFPSFLLTNKQVLTLEIYNDGAAQNRYVDTVFTGLRINKERDQLTNDDRRDVLDAIEKYYSPQLRSLVMPVVFEQNGTAKAKTPKQDEPILIYGFRSTFTDAKVNFGFSERQLFATEKFPIWALASEVDNARQLYQMLDTPLFLSSRDQLYFNFENTIDKVTNAQNGQIEILATTV